MGLDQLQLLRSQHKMARLLLVAALCQGCRHPCGGDRRRPPELPYSSRGVWSPSEEEHRRMGQGVRPLLHGDPLPAEVQQPRQPLRGWTCPCQGSRFIRNAPFDDMDLDIEFNGGSAIDGLFDMKEDYKFIQKFMFLADRPQEGSFVLFTYLPYNMDQAWTYEGGREHTANGGFTLTHKITHGENVIQEAEWVFDVKAN